MNLPTQEEIINAVIRAQKNRSLKCPRCGGWQIEEQDCLIGLYHRFKCANCGELEDVIEKDRKAMNKILGITVKDPK